MDIKNSKMHIDLYGNKYWINEFSNGYKAWWRNEKRHRADGPAIENVNGYKVWRLNNIKFTKEEFNSWIGRIKALYND